MAADEANRSTAHASDSRPPGGSSAAIFFCLVRRLAGTMPARRWSVGGRASRAVGTTPALLVCLALAALALAACSPNEPTGSQTGGLGAACPVPSPNLLPLAWQPIGNGTLISIDGDADNECLIPYRYSIANNSGPLGAVVYDPQLGSGGSANLIAYPLLPWSNRSYNITDTVPGSLPGKLGPLGDKSLDIRLYDSDDNGTYEELGIVGADAASVYTTLSLFRWAGQGEGYRLLGYFHGNSRVQIMDPPRRISDTLRYNGLINTVRSFDRFFDRNNLAMVYQYERTANADGPTFVYRSNWLEFADGWPSHRCLYPEGQTLIYYAERGNRPVFDLKVYSEDDRNGRAVVCAGTWDVTPTQWRRYVALVNLEKKPKSAIDGCDEWVVRGEQIIDGKFSCTP